VYACKSWSIISLHTDAQMRGHAQGKSAQRLFHGFATHEFLGVLHHPQWLYTACAAKPWLRALGIVTASSATVLRGALWLLHDDLHLERAFRLSLFERRFAI